MKTLRVPSFLIGGVASLPDLFLNAGNHRRLPRTEAKRLAELLPPVLWDSPCFLDRLTGLWRYDFGNPFDGLPDGGFTLGTHMFQPVERLFDVLFCAQHRLTPDQLSSYLVRLADPNKHEDVLMEFAPILHLSSDVQTFYEVVGYGVGNRTIDWLIKGLDCPPVLLDVKNRTRDLLESLARTREGERDPDGTVPAPVHDTSLLFRNLEPKFEPHKPEDVLQGAWIATHLQQEETELVKSFAKLDRTRVHFAILGGWEEDVYILGGTEFMKAQLLRVFLLKESKRFVFNRA